MGVLHLAGLGLSPGAVTCGLGYLQQKHGSRTNEQGKIVDEVVVFTSPEVASGELLSQGEVVLNHYGKTSALRSWSGAPVLDVLAECFNVQFPAAALHVCTVDLNDFNDALRVVAQTLHRFHPPGSVGRHVQINLTGGVNVLNSALFQAANLSGLVAKFYYTFAPRENLKYLLPAAKDNPSAFRYQEVPVLTTRAQLDELLQYLLLVLSELQDGAWLDSEELRSLLARGLGEAPDKQAFERDYLNVLDGQFLRRKGERGSDGRNRNTEVQLTAHGRQLLSVMESPWFRALHRDEKLQTVSKEELTQGLLLQQVWPKVK